MTTKSHRTNTDTKITLARLTLITTVSVAIISLIGNLILGYWQFGRKSDEGSPSVSAAESNSLAIEQLPGTIFVYDGRAQNAAGWSNLGISYLNATPYYEFSYSVPTDQTGYAGLAMRLADGQDLSAYQRVEFTLRFDNKESEHAIDFYMSDISGKKSHVRLTEIGSGEKKESQLLTNFSGINLNAIKEITFNIDNSVATGNHTVTISNLHFLP